MPSEPRLARATEPAPSEGADTSGEEIVALRAMVEGTARGTGAAFFQSLVRHLAAAVKVSYAFVAEFADVNTRARTLAYWAKDHIEANIEWELAGTPCA